MNLAFAIAALGGCGADLPPIELDDLEPDWAYNGEVSPITVTGANFYPSVTASSFAEPQVKSGFRAWLETDPPTELFVRPMTLTALEIQVPEGLEVGTYGLTVESSDGNRDTLDDALEVTNSRADHLAAFVEADDEDLIVGQWVPVRFQVQNRDDDIELESLEVNVVASLEDVELDSGTLARSAPIEGGVQGTIEDGQASVLLKSNVNDTVWLTVTPTIPTSVVQPVSVPVIFRAGRVAEISVDVEDPTSLVAGADTSVVLALRDVKGAIVDDDKLEVTILEACDGFNQATHELSGEQTFTFPLHRASGSPGCPKNQIQVFVDEDVSGESEMLDVAAGPAAQLGVLTSPEMTAGEPTGTVWVFMQDAFGNAVDDYDTAAPDLQLEDDVGGLQPGDPGKGSQACSRFENGWAECTVEVWKADPDVHIRAKDGHGFVGESAPFTVVAGPAAYIEVAPQLPVVQAGDDLQVRIYVTDGPGNVIHVESSSALYITDENEAPLDCQYVGIDPTISYEVHVFECQFTQVGTHRVSVDMPSAGLYDFESFDIAVQNGELAVISIDLGTTTVGAGQTFYADFVGTDAWGNPYVVQSDPDFDVRDASGTLTPTWVHLDASGRALNEPMNLKRAALTNRLVAMQDGAWLGSSPVFAITAGAFDEFLVDVDGPVVSIDDPGSVVVSAVDPYGNAIPSYDTPVSLYSQSGLGPRITVNSWVDGRAAVEYPFDTLGWGDALVAEDGDKGGESTVFDVVDFGCPAGPTAHLVVGSGLPLRLCLLPGMGATTFDLSGSVKGAELIDAYYYLRGDGTTYTTTSSGWSTNWTQPGGYAVSGIVVDHDLCASEESGWVYVGYDDGQPVGPVGVSISGGATSVHAADGWVTVDVTAWTCAGDPAISGTLLASVDNGSLVPTGTNRWTGSGLELGLDAFGMASIEWNMFGQAAGGLGTFVAGVRSGAAHGEVTLDIEGDTSHPTVLEVSPVGTLHDDFDSIAILFSDPMQAASIDGTSVQLTDPFGTPIGLDDLTLASSGRELVIDFQAQGGDAGAYTLTLDSSVRKAPGPYDNANTLDGDYDVPGAGDFVVSFGAVAETAPDILACDPSTTLFRPDGDVTGDDPFEADVVDLDLTATGPAAFWLLEVFDPFADRVFVSHFVAHDLDTGTVSWDGRSDDGTILENGTYTVAVTAKDASWNEGAPCLANVTIDNLLAPVGE